MPEQTPRLMLIDANALVHRAYHAIQGALTVRKTGEQVNAVYGFTEMLLKALAELKPRYVAAAFDTARPTFRHEQFEEYKKNRPKAAEDLVSQFPRVRQVLEALSIPVFMLDGFEADDILGTLAVQSAGQGVETVIVTGDADAMQLVNPVVKVFTPGKTFRDVRLYDASEVLLKYGVHPGQIPDLKGLVGDPSDNIPGVKGIGEKTAARLLNQFKTLEEIYHHLDEVGPPKVQEMLRAQRDIALKSKGLATIDTNVPVKLDLESCRLSSFDRNRVAALFRELEFVSLLKRLPSPGAEQAMLPEEAVVSRVEGSYRPVTTEAELQELGSRLTDAAYLAVGVETSGKDSMSAPLVGVSLSCREGESFYIPLGHQGLDGMLQLPYEKALSWLRPVLAGGRLRKVSHNGKFTMNVLARHGVEISGWDFDTAVAAYLLNEKSLTLRDLAFKRLGLEMPPITDLTGAGQKQTPIAMVPFERLTQYAGAGVDVTARLYRLLEAELGKEDLWDLFSQVEMPLVPILSRMERTGIALDLDVMRTLSRNLNQQVNNLEGDIYRNVGHEFNINSPQQLAAVLFEDLKLEGKRRTKKGYSTDASVLEELKGAHPVIELIMTYRQLSKLKSTYVDALPGMVNSQTGRLHTTLNQTSVTTGRLSSSDPNLQNIPVRGELGKEIRRSFIAESGWSLVGADYSQIDLRVLAHLSQDPRLVEAFRHDEDIHTATARDIFGVSLEKVTPDMRRLAKTVNFGVIYGMSDYGLEQATDLSREEAAQFIQSYFEKYPGVAAYLESTRRQARELGYVQTLLGRRRYIPEVNSPNRQLREAAERMAINMPVQGTSADIIKVAMVRLHRAISDKKLRTKMLLQVHDDLLFEVPPEEIDEVKRLVGEIMPQAVPLSVPVKVDIKVGRNWGEME
ncbi:MAG: DNA polymerase I [Chloroflexi bacterium]|nr:DNA polymerase I [Chloroflexota bacterium]